MAKGQQDDDGNLSTVAGTKGRVLPRVLASCMIDDHSPIYELLLLLLFPVRCIHNYLRNAHLNAFLERRRMKKEAAGSSSVCWSRWKCQQVWLTVLDVRLPISYCIRTRFSSGFVCVCVLFSQEVAQNAQQEQKSNRSTNYPQILIIRGYFFFRRFCRCLGTFDWASWRAS